MKNITLLISILVWLPNLTTAQAPDLKSTSSFGLFTATGAIDNTGTTNVWGDIGSNSTGSSTGSSITLVVGSTHYSDATSSTAATDVVTAYSYMTGLSCDSTISTPFGNGLTLVPGRVYCLSSASTLNGDLILDAKGDPSAIFIFKIAGALTTSSSSRVILINSAALCNVYWQIGGAASLGTNSLFRGTMLVDGAINLLAYDTLEGRGLTKAGAINLNNNRVVGCDASGQALPIELIRFYAKPIGQNAQLFWSTASETNNDFFTIERSKDGILFTDLLSVNGAGNSSQTLHYSAMDYHPHEGTSFYRLKQTDIDGKISYSCLVSFHFVQAANFKLFPNPIHNSFTIRIDDVLVQNNCKLSIVNTLGKQVIKKNITKMQTSFSADNLPSGIYFYNVYQNGVTMQSGKMVVEH
jgi:hypothetical protein